MSGEKASPLLEKGGAGPIQREFVVLDPTKNLAKKFASNSIVTYKYTALPFSPNFVVWKNLFEQFHKAANGYFLLISALQLVPGLSPTGSYTTLIPLCLVLFVTMAKDAYVDLQRHKSDREVNARQLLAFRDGKFTSVPWSDLRVGEIVKVMKGEHFPADLGLLYSTGAEGSCCIETAQLDGETNLKTRKVPYEITLYFDPNRPDTGIGTVACEMPNNNLATFSGRYVRNGSTTDIPLNAENILLRGATLRNTDFVMAFVIYTGVETKLMQNSSSRSLKLSNVDNVTNRQVLYIFLMQVLIVVTCAATATITLTTIGDHWYLGLKSNTVNTGVYFFSSFATFLILFNNLIPISLYIQLETVKLIEASFINSDIDLYHAETNMPANAQVASLNEELGQVEFIFSDKTGTLTCNMMDFLKFSCGRYDSKLRREVPVVYGTGTTEVARAAAARAAKDQRLPKVVEEDDRPPGWKPRNGFFFYDERISDDAWARQENAVKLEFFFSFLAICHSVLPEVNAQGELVYQAASPDEACLVKAAKHLGVEFLARRGNIALIRVRGEVQQWEVLNTFEFDSARKRMSVIVRDPDGTLMLLCKGADTVIYERLRKDVRSIIQEETQALLNKFAAEGLRTLVLAMSILDQDEYIRWNKLYVQAAADVHDRSRKLAEVAELIERNLDLIGTTAIEDKLQEGVPQTIELLASAGIKIWVLTGDKQETAINIGFACNLLSNDMGLFTFSDCNEGNIAQVLQCYLTDASHVVGQDLGLVIEGNTLQLFLSNEQDVKGTLSREVELFLCLSTRCGSVVCCRVSPLQKALIVLLVKENMATVTLAVGDGANDVPMIQAAHVGVGISGLEGLQAARAADYSIAQFRFLQRLLLIHGRYNYRRVARLILYCFYKNICLFLTQFWFTTVNFFTGQSFYDQWALSMYNVAFSAYPIMVLACLDRDVRKERLLTTDQFPELYHDGLKSTLFNTMTFWLYIGNGILHSALSFFLGVYLTQYFSSTTGQEVGLPGSGCTTYTAVLILVTVKLALEVQSWTIANVVVIVVSILLWFVFLGIYGNFYAVFQTVDFAQWYGMPSMVLTEPLYWLSVLIIVSMALLRDVCWKVWRHNYQQKLMHVVQEFEHIGKPFTKRDVLRVAPDLLPKQQPVRPYNPRASSSSAVFIESELAIVPNMTMSTIKQQLRKNAGSTKIQAADIKKTTQARNVAISTAPASGAFFARPGTMSIGQVIFDDIL